MSPVTGRDQFPIRDATATTVNPSSVRRRASAWNAVGERSASAVPSTLRSSMEFQPSRRSAAS